MLNSLINGLTPTTRLTFSERSNIDEPYIIPSYGRGTKRLLQL